MPGENREEYLETIYELTEEKKTAKTSEIADKLKVKPASVTQMLKKLADEEYIKYEPYKGTTLTKKGRHTAKKLKRKHRLLERFLYDILGIRRNRVHDEACQMEHSLSDEAADALERVMDYPEQCPDDKKPIPKKKETHLKKGETHLVNLPTRKKAKIKKLNGGQQFKTNMRTMGIREGKNITLISRHPMGGPCVIEVGNMKVTIGRGMASKIIVEDIP